MAHLNTEGNHCLRKVFIFVKQKKSNYEAVSVSACIPVQLIDWWLIQGSVCDALLGCLGETTLVERSLIATHQH